MLHPTNAMYFQSPPYSMYKDSQKRLTGNDVFEGYAIDLIKEVAEILSKFFYIFARFCAKLNM